MSDGTIVGSALRGGNELVPPTTADVLPLVHPRSWHRFVGPGISLLLLVAVVMRLRHIDTTSMVRLMPTSVGFWFAFLVYYFMSPATEWVIFRRLWGIPPRGFFALVRKLVSNELLMGYVGELSFYTWARRNAHLTAAPFGAIKDVTILSGLVGNFMTLVMVGLAAPLLGSIELGVPKGTLIWSAVIVVVSSAAVLLFRRTFFTLPRKNLLMIAALHLMRVITTTAVAALMWHLLLPSVALTWWLVLGALRLLVSRLPLLPNKDVVFAGLASFLVGNAVGIGSAMALMAALILTMHLVMGAMLGAGELASRRTTT